MKPFIPASDNGFQLQWKQFFFSQMKPSLKLGEANFLKQVIKKIQLQLLKNNFLASRNYFLLFSQTAVNCYQWKQFFLQLEHIFLRWLFILAGRNEFFCLLKTVLFYSEFFSASGHFIKLPASVQPLDSRLLALKIGLLIYLNYQSTISLTYETW